MTKDVLGDGNVQLCVLVIYSVRVDGIVVTGA
jgi:hypothetical protein